MKRRKRKLIISKTLFIIIIAITSIYLLYSFKFDILTILNNSNDFMEYENYKKENLTRYNKYKRKNPNYENELIVSHVNINLDSDFYTNIKESINRDTDLVLVNKHYSLSSDYVPKNLKTLSISCASNYNIYMTERAKTAFEEICMDAYSLGLTIKGVSGYRSYEFQKTVYNSYLKQDSKEKVDTYSARAGHSEHQTGLAIDVYNSKLGYNRFGETNEYNWLKINAHKYGYIIRYSDDLDYITGFMNEPWHIRYVGSEVATYIYENNITLEEYLLNNKGAI